MNMYTKLFSQLSKDSAEIAGGKGASLGEMTNAGIPVPPGYVVLASTFDVFIHETDLIQEIEAALDKVDHNVMHTVERASETIQGLIMNADTPQSIQDKIMQEFKKLDVEFVAVRSSATAEDGAEHAWAGQLDSFLNTTDAELLSNVKKCWASLFTPRAIFYRFEKGLHDTQISVAVVIQKMVNSEKSGIAFSVHPVTEDTNQMIIEAGLGLGEAIVSGAVTPDAYVIEKDTEMILDVNVNEQLKALYRDPNGGNIWKDLSADEAKGQVLQRKEVMQLADIITTIENHYGFPCDIEWAYEDGEFYITQSRPITTLKNIKKKEITKHIYQRHYVRDFAMILEEAWVKGLRKVHKDVLKTEPLIDIPSIFYSRDGVIETWQNDEYFTKLKQDILKYNIANPTFIDGIIEEYMPILEKFKIDRKNKKTCNSLEDINKLIHIIQRAIFLWIVWAHTVYVEETPKEIWNKAMKVRDMDTFWDDADYILRQSIINIHPRVTGAENTVLFNELSEINEISDFSNRLSGHAFIPGEFNGQVALDEITKKYPEIEFRYPRNEIIDNSFKGEIAFNTHDTEIIAKVRIIKRKDRAHELQSGEALVSSMTTPDFEHAMQKAAITITDEGGITCHAAVVAREMKLPCVIGTQIASTVLQDGDEVSVNMQTGMVKVLNREIILNNTSPSPKAKGDELGSSEQLIAEKENNKENIGSVNISKGPHWQKTVSRNVSILQWDAQFKVRSQGLKYGEVFWSTKANLVVNHPKLSSSTVYMDLSYDYNSETNIFEYLREPNDTLEALLLKLEKSVEVDLKLEPGKSFDDVRFLYERHKENMGIMAMGYAWAFHFEEILKEKVGEKYWDQIKGYALSPHKKTLLIREYDDLIKLASLDGKEKDWAIKEVVRKYGYVHAECIGEEFKEEDYITTLEFLPQTGANKKTELEIPEPEDFYLKWLINMLRRVVYVYDEGKTALVRASWAMRKTILALGFDDQKILALTESEFYSWIDDQDMPSHFNLEDRQKYFAIYSNIDKYEIFFGKEEVEKIIDRQRLELIEPSVNDDILRGSTGQKGKVQGRVRIIHNQKDCDKFEQGEILVASMTTPELLGAMYRAAAFITDEGGVTCHAAIVSRELGIPCVVGTKFATQVLSDGDLVEVDADNGLVNILK